MILYLDTSAFVKLYMNEPCADQVRDLVAETKAVYTHALTYVEMRSALARALRFNRLTETELAEHKQSLESDWNRMEIITISDPLIRRAGDLTEHHNLRAYDSVHLAAAESVWNLAGANVEFCFAVFDNQLLDAAQKRNMPVLK